MALIETSRGRKMIVWRDTDTGLRVVWNGGEQVNVYTAPPQGELVAELGVPQKGGKHYEDDARIAGQNFLRLHHDTIDEMLRSGLMYTDTPSHPLLPPSAWDSHAAVPRDAVRRRPVPRGAAGRDDHPARHRGWI